MHTFERQRANGQRYDVIYGKKGMTWQIDEQS